MNVTLIFDRAAVNTQVGALFRVPIDCVLREFRCGTSSSNLCQKPVSLRAGTLLRPILLGDGVEKVPFLGIENPLPAEAAVELKAEPKKKPSRFDTPGKKWLEYKGEFEELGPRNYRMQGRSDDGYLPGTDPRRLLPHQSESSVMSARGFTHNRTLRGRVNVAQCQVDDPCGDDVAEG
jgi:hypothetical protein